MGKYALNLAEDHRILSATFEQYAPENAVLVDELPEGNIADYLYRDGQYIYAPLPEPEPEPVEPTAEERITALEEALAQTDETAIALYEAQAEQEAINAAQDDALIELYEMMEG